MSEDTLGKRLRRSMDDAGLTNRDLARLVKCNEAHLSRWKGDHVSPSPRNLNRLAEALGVDPVWLRTGKPSVSEVMDRSRRAEEAKAAAIEDEISQLDRRDLDLETVRLALSSGLLAEALRRSTRFRRSLRDAMREMGRALDSPENEDRNGNDNDTPTARSAG